MLGVNGAIRVSWSHMDPVINVSPNDTPEKGGAEYSSDTKQSSHSIFKYTLLALGLALFIRFFIATPYVVNGASMVPTFYDWHYLIVDKLIYDIYPPERGDIIVFKLPQDPSRSLIKRVIGLPGEEVKIEDSKITIFNSENKDGLVLSEPYLDPKDVVRGDQLEITLGEGEYFVLGDNRRASADSRLWGKLPESYITGRVDLRLFPLNMIDIFPGEARYE
ncbi:MAG TPA: signal peptidase I [Candidatus Paceibacterota bacterium]